MQHHLIWATVTHVILLPAMFRLKEAAINPAELQQLFLTVSRWSGVNDFIHVLTFCFDLWALALVFSSPKQIAPK